MNNGTPDGAPSAAHEDEFSPPPSSMSQGEQPLASEAEPLPGWPSPNGNGEPAPPEGLAGPSPARPTGDWPVTGTGGPAPGSTALTAGGRPSFRQILLGTKLGRAFLLTALALALFWGLSAYERSGRPAAKMPQDRPANSFEDTLTTADELKTLYVTYGERLGNAEKELGALGKDIGAVRQDVEAFRKSVEDLLKRNADRDSRLNGILRTLEEQLLGPKKSREDGDPESSLENDARGRIEVLSFNAGSPPGKVRKALTVPAASGGEATLMNGVFAPVSGEPAPVRLRLDAALIGPNRSRVPLRDAFLIGKAQGDANSSRVTVEVTTLSYVTADGRAMSFPVRGYVVGDDGFEGVPGTYHYRAEEQLPLAGLTALVSGGAEALAERETTRSLTPLGGVTQAVTGDPLRFAGFQGLSGMSKKFEEIVAERLREIRPAVYTKPGRRAHVVFLDALTLEDVSAEETHYDLEINPYAGLDLHH